MSAGPSSNSAAYRKGGHGGASPGYRHWGNMSQSSAQAFTADMRDRQARGKDPYRSGEVSDDGAEMDDTKMRLGGWVFALISSHIFGDATTHRLILTGPLQDTDWKQTRESRGARPSARSLRPPSSTVLRCS